MSDVGFDFNPAVSNFFRGVTLVGGARHVLNSTVAIDGNYHTFKFVVGSSSVEYLIDGVSFGVILSIPAGNILMSVELYLQCLAFGGKKFDVDYLLIYMNRG